MVNEFAQITQPVKQEAVSSRADCTTLAKLYILYSSVQYTSGRHPEIFHVVCGQIKTCSTCFPCVLHPGFVRRLIVEAIKFQLLVLLANTSMLV